MCVCVCVYIYIYIYIYIEAILEVCIYRYLIDLITFCKAFPLGETTHNFIKNETSYSGLFVFGIIEAITNDVDEQTMYVHIADF